MRAVLPRSTRALSVRVVAVDLRPIIARGEHPLKLVLSLAAELDPTARLELRAPFQPVPLIEKLQAQGFIVEASEAGAGDWLVRVQRRPPHERVKPSVSMAQIRADQGPPLGVPLGFFATAAMFLCIGGFFIVVRGDSAHQNMWSPTILALVHIVTVGFLLPVMWGALYQMLPVVVGVTAARMRLAYATLACAVGGALALIASFAWPTLQRFNAAASMWALATVLFLASALPAFRRTAASTPTTWGIRLAIIGLVCVVAVGIQLALTRSGLLVTRDYMALRVAHMGAGTLLWVGGLIAAVSWQVLSMFYLVPAPNAWLTRGVLGASAIGVVAVVLSFAVPMRVDLLLLLFIPCAAALWLAQPGWVAFALSKRKRKRKDATLWFWWLAVVMAPAALVLTIVSRFIDSDRMPLALGVIVAWGWAGATVVGMLTRIIPFLVWLHWCSPHVGQRPVPAMRDLVTESQVKVAFGLHVTVLIISLASVATQSDWAWRGLGAVLAAQGVTLISIIGFALRRGHQATSATS